MSQNVHEGDFEPAEGNGGGRGSNQSAGMVRREGAMGGMELARTAETAIAAAAEQARALVEARYAVALKRPRDILVVRSSLMNDAKRFGFAEQSEYKKPLGSKWDPEKKQWVKQYAIGPSIRFAESALRAMGNIYIAAPVLYEDDDKRMVSVIVTDLESNLGYDETFTITKFTEKRDAKGRDIVSKRTNSEGKLTYLVRATDDELANKVNANKSKAIRNQGLRLIPGDVIEDAIRQCRATKNEELRRDPKAAVKRLLDRLAAHNVSAKQVREYLGHDIEQLSKDEWDDLIGIGAAIADGQSTWADAMETRHGSSAAPDSDKGTAAPSNAKARVVARAKEAAAPKPAEKPKEVVDPSTGEVSQEELAKMPVREPGEEG